MPVGFSHVLVTLGAGTAVAGALRQGHYRNCNGYRCYSIYQFFHDVVLFGFIPIDSFFMKIYEYSRVILRSLLQIKSHKRRGGNAVPARNTAFFFQLPAMGITQLLHKPPLQLLP